MGSSSVVVPRVLGEGRPQVAFAKDQQPVGDLGPGGEHEPFLWVPKTVSSARRSTTSAFEDATGSAASSTSIRRSRDATAFSAPTGVTEPVSHVYLPVSLTAPAPSGSTGTTRHWRGCSHPPRQPAAQAASSFTPPLRRPGDGRSHTSIRANSASWRTFLSYTFPSRSPRPPHPAVPDRRDFVEAAPAFPGDPRLRLPPASPRRCDGEEMDGLSPPSETTAPRGARKPQAHDR
jgi:hypothetical protein